MPQRLGNILTQGGINEDSAWRKSIASHSFAHEDGRLAHDAGVKLLVLRHLMPAERSIARDEDCIAEVRKHFSGNVMVGVDDMKIKV